MRYLLLGLGDGHCQVYSNRVPWSKASLSGTSKPKVDSYMCTLGRTRIKCYSHGWSPGICLIATRCNVFWSVASVSASIFAEASSSSMTRACQHFSLSVVVLFFVFQVALLACCLGLKDLSECGGQPALSFFQLRICRERFCRSFQTRITEIMTE